jgi:hypothetical protein
MEKTASQHSNRHKTVDRLSRFEVEPFGTSIIENTGATYKHRDFLASFPPLLRPTVFAIVLQTRQGKLGFTR